MEYRKDIAGLRAVAVMPILLFHAGVSALPGGFVGVDVFFVISGYLITSIIFRDIDSSKFSITEFYRRRAARIFPALIFVLISTISVGWFLMLPSELRDLGASATAASLFVSNVYFFQAADYFGSTAELTPLLHTWSLAVEEQFYVFFPALLIILSRWAPAYLRHFVVGACVLSLLSGLFLAGVNSSAVFYLIPTRAWELGLGSVIALGCAPTISSPLLRNIIAASGLALILGSVFIIHPSALFPAPLAIFPCVGAAAIIAYGEGTGSARLLSLGPMQWIGKVSYSLYLWHWPVIVFYRLETGVSLGPWETLALVTASMVLAWMTFSFIERPCLQYLRQRPSVGAKTVVFGGLSALLVVAGLSQLTTLLARNYSYLPKRIAWVSSFVDYRETPDHFHQFRPGECFRGEADEQGINHDCLKVSDTAPNVVVLGDSHAAQYWRAISEILPNHNVIQATASGCRPLLEPKGAKRCTDLVRHVLSQVVTKAGVQAVVLAGRWQENEVYDLVATAAALKDKGVNVFVIGPSVEFDGDFPSVLARSMMQNDPSAIERSRVKDREVLDHRMRSAIEASNVTYISAYSLECGNARCVTVDSKGAPYHFDYGHLTLDASRELVRRMKALSDFSATQP